MYCFYRNPSYVPVSTSLNENCLNELNFTGSIQQALIWLDNQHIQLRENPDASTEHQNAVEQLLRYLQIENVDQQWAIEVETLIQHYAQPSPHVIEMAGNTHGRDLVGSDPHGSLAVCQKVVESLHEGDRLFLCGDLVDRGADSLALITYIEQQQTFGKTIIVIRGNHEDLTLTTLDLFDILDAIKNPNIATSPFTQQWLGYLTADEKSNVLTIYEKIVADIKLYTERGLLNSRVLRTINENHCEYFYQPNIKAFFEIFLNRFAQGGAWMLTITPEERKQLRRFIEPLPYIIRVGAVTRDNAHIPAFDITHAAPLSEFRLTEVLRMPHATLSSQDIAYCTWARPPSLKVTGQPIISDMDRTLGSIRTYVGHNVVSAPAEIYQDIHVLNLDAQSVTTHCMFIADHTHHQIIRVSAVNKEENEETPQVLAAFNALQKLIDPTYYAPLKLEIYGFFARLSRHASPCNPFDPNNPTDLKLFKDNFINSLRREAPSLSIDKKEALAVLLLQRLKHPLAKRLRHKDYSHETRTMHKAIGLLLNGNTKAISSTSAGVTVHTHKLATADTQYIQDFHFKKYGTQYIKPPS